MEIEFRIVSPADAHLLERVAEDVFDAMPQPARISAYLASPGHYLMVALLEGEIVAQAAAVVHRHVDQPTELYIDNLGVTPRLHRRGIAREMIRRLFELGRSVGCEEAWVGTEIGNQPARALYEGLGADGESFVMYVYEL